MCAAPLTLAIAAARAASEPDQPLAAPAAELRGTEDVLGVLGLDDGATDLRTVFSWSYRTLNPAAARLFRLLAVHPARISPCLPPPAWQRLRGQRRTTAWSSWAGPAWSASTHPAGTSALQEIGGDYRPAVCGLGAWPS